MKKQVAEKKLIQPSAKRGKIARRLENDLLELRRRMGRNFLEMGKILKVIRDKEYYRELGYDTVTEWLSSPDVAISASWAWNFIAIYEIFMERHKLEPDRILDISYNKLTQIIPVVRKSPDQIEDWLNKAEVLRRIDLQKEIKEHRIEKRIKREKKKRDDPEEFTLVLGDPIKELGKIKSKTIDLVLTAPPLSDNEEPTVADIFSYQRKWLDEAHRVLKDDGVLLAISDYHGVFIIGAEIQRLGMKLVRDIVWTMPYAKRAIDVHSLVPVHEIIVWAKKGKKHLYNFTHVERDVWELPNAVKTEYPLDKPPLLISKLIEMTTDEGDLVLDPFAGSGTVLLEADKLRRNYIGIEKSEEWYRVTEERIK